MYVCAYICIGFSYNLLNYTIVSYNYLRLSQESFCPSVLCMSAQAANCPIVQLFTIFVLCFPIPPLPLSITEVQSFAFLFYPKFSVFTYFLLFSSNLFSPLFSIFLYVKPSKLSTVLLCLLHAYSWPSSLPPLCHIKPLHPITLQRSNDH